MCNPLDGTQNPRSQCKSSEISFAIPWTAPRIPDLIANWLRFHLQSLGRHPESQISIKSSEISFAIPWMSPKIPDLIVNRVRFDLRSLGWYPEFRISLRIVWDFISDHLEGTQNPRSHCKTSEISFEIPWREPRIPDLIANRVKLMIND
jgi:hypothetical protein